MEGDVHRPQCSCDGIQQTHLLGVELPTLTGHTVHPHQAIASVQQPGSTCHKILHLFLLFVLAVADWRTHQRCFKHEAAPANIFVMFRPAMFAHGEGSDSRALLHRPHLQDSPARSIDNQEQSVASGKGGGGGGAAIASLLWNLQPAQLSISVTCS